MRREPFRIVMPANIFMEKRHFRPLPAMHPRPLSTASIMHTMSGVAEK
jgi:hypothetical protein